MKILMLFISLNLINNDTIKNNKYQKDIKEIENIIKYKPNTILNKKFEKHFIIQEKWLEYYKNKK